MDYSLIRKVQKARQYAQEPERFSFKSFDVCFHGTHHEHIVTYRGDGFHCDCEYFESHSTCSHTMALERVLGEMMPH